MKILHTADWHIGSFKGPEQDGVNLRSMDTLKCLEEYPLDEGYSVSDNVALDPSTAMFFTS